MYTNVIVGKSPIQMKKSRKKPVEGDIFVIQPVEKIFVYGKVILTNIKSSNVLVNGMCLVYVYNVITEGIQKNIILDYNDLMLPPEVIGELGWMKGYLLTIGHQPVTEKERGLDYGFMTVDRASRRYKEDKDFVSISGEPLNHKPKYLGYSGLSNYATIFKAIIKAQNWEEQTMDNSTNAPNNDSNVKLRNQINPFTIIQNENSSSLTLEINDYKNEIFLKRADEGFEGNGYDWTSLSQVFLNEKMPELKDEIEFDSEAGMFCAYSVKKEVIEQFAIGFKSMCEDEDLMRDLFSRTELD